MATISFSPSLVSAITNQLTTLSTNGGALNTSTYLFTTLGATSWTGTYGGYANPGSFPATVYFKNSAGNTLASLLITALTRTQDVNGYVAFSNFPELTPTLAGTIDYIQISQSTVTYVTGYNGSVTYGTGTSYYSVTLTVGDTGSGADVEIANRDLVTNQPWRLDGSIRFRVPDSYTYSS